MPVKSSSKEGKIEEETNYWKNVLEYVNVLTFQT